MQARTRKHHTDKTSKIEKIIDCNEDRAKSLDYFFRENFGDFPQWAVVLRGLRNREGLSQASLGQKLGVAQTNISQMELGKRPIGKALAKKFAAFFKTDYHLFL